MGADFVFVVLLFGLLSNGALAKTKAENFTAVMTGANMVPPVSTPATGTTLLEFKGSKDNTLDYIVTVHDLVGPRSVELHDATSANATTEPHIAYLYGPVNNTNTQPINGVLASGSLTKSNITGTAQQKKHDVKSLRTSAEKGNLYVLVNTTAHPNGELRGHFTRS